MPVHTCGWGRSAQLNCEDDLRGIVLDVPKPDVIRATKPKLGESERGSSTSVCPSTRQASRRWSTLSRRRATCATRGCARCWPARDGTTCFAPRATHTHRLHAFSTRATECLGIKSRTSDQAGRSARKSNGFRSMVHAGGSERSAARRSFPRKRAKAAQDPTSPLLLAIALALAPR